MKFAWIENGTVRDVCPGVPADLYTPEIAVFYDTQVGDDIRADATLVNGVWTNKPEPAPIPVFVPPRRWSAQDVRDKLTLADRIKWDNDKSDAIKTAKIEFATPQLVAHTTEVLQLLVDSGDISAATMQAVLA